MLKHRILVLILTVLVIDSVSFSYGKETFQLEDFLGELIDLQRLSRLPEEGITCRQISSYDRRSRIDPKTGEKLDWYANNDAGNFIGEDEKCKILVDLDGPGVIVRIWAANPKGMLKIYLDHQKEPTIKCDFKEFFSGKLEPFVSPLVGVRAYGANSYFPIPYQTHIRIVVDNPGELYYHVNYRTYPERTKVGTFSLPLQGKTLEKVYQIAKVLDSVGEYPFSFPEKSNYIDRTVTLKPNEEKILANIKGPSAIYAFRVFTVNADNVRSTLRENILFARWDGHLVPDICVPLGDFFGTSPGANHFSSLPMGMTENGFYSYWFMPFQKSGEISLRNLGEQEIQLHYRIVFQRIRNFDGYSYFHAKWRRDYPNKEQDWAFLKAEGRGRYVGAMLTVWHPMQRWWGEGDEKIWVDDDKFPSWFGTGTEDYFGYALSASVLFSHAFHNQTICEGPGHSNYTSQNRWHIIDNIPFQNSIEVTVEVYQQYMDYASTAYWYAEEGSHDFFIPIRTHQLKLHPPKEAFSKSDYNDSKKSETILEEGTTVTRQNEEDMEDKHLLLWFKMDEDSRVSIKDLSGNMNDGIMKEARWIRDEDGRGGIRFERNRFSYVVIPLSESLRGLKGPFTVEIDARIEEQPRKGLHQYLVASEHYHSTGSPNQDNCGFALWAGENGRINFYVFGLEPPEISSETTVEVGRWYRIIASYDGMSLHLNVDGERTSQQVTGKFRSPTADFYLGTLDLAQHYLTGIIREVKIYNTAFVPQE